MISEKKLAWGFESVWHSLFPMLTPTFMHIFNEDFLKPISKSCTNNFSTLQFFKESPDIVSEFGIQLAQNTVEGKISIADISKDKDALYKAWNQAQSLMSKYEGMPVRETETRLLDTHINQGIYLAKNLIAFTESIDGVINFSPCIPGANAVTRCEADLSIGETLVEIKTVNRTFRSRDLRQLLVYLALDWIRGPKWKKGCLLNPKLGKWADFEVDQLVRRLSGRSASDTFRDLIHAVGSNIELETTMF